MFLEGRVLYMDNKNNIPNSMKKAFVNATLFGVSASSVVGCSQNVSPINPNVESSIEAITDSSIKAIKSSNKENPIVTKKTAEAIKNVVSEIPDFEEQTSYYQGNEFSDVDLNEGSIDENFTNSKLGSEENIYDSIDLSDYKGVSINDALIAKGVNSDKDELKAFRIAAAEYYGIVDYCVNGFISGEKNIELLNIFRLPANERPRKQQIVSNEVEKIAQEEQVLKEDLTIEEGMYEYERVIIYEAIDSKTHRKIDKWVCLNNLKEKIISIEILSCNFERYYNPLLKLNQNFCKDCHQFVYPDKEKQNNDDYDNNDFVDNNANHSNQSSNTTHNDNNHKDNENHKHRYIRTIRYRKGMNGHHFEVETITCADPKCNYKIENTFYKDCVGEWKYDASSDSDYFICDCCGLKSERKHEHKVVDAKQDLVWIEGTETHKLVETGICSVCGKVVVEVKKEGIPCSKQIESIDGKDVPVCKDCHHQYPSLDEECKHNFVGDIKYTYKSLGNGQHVISSKKQYCDVCKKYIDLELTEDEKKSVNCNYGSVQTDDQGQKYKECDLCHHKEYEKECVHDVENITYEYEYDEATDQHRIVKATGVCKNCGETVEVELTEEQKKWQSCSFGEVKEDSDGNKYQECSICGHKKYVKEECKDHQVTQGKESLIHNEGTNTHDKVITGICDKCGKEVTIILEKDINCNQEWSYNVDGRDISKCPDCGYIYDNIAHNHSPKAGSVHTETKTDDGWCMKTGGICATCGELYILEDQSSKGHAFELAGIVSVINPDTFLAEKKEKYVCGNCGEVEYRDVASKTEEKTDEPEIESETEEFSQTVDSTDIGLKDEENSTEIDTEQKGEVASESETEEYSQTVESTDIGKKDEENSTEIKIEQKGDVTSESETEEYSQTVESTDIGTKDDAKKEDNNIVNQVADLRNLLNGLILNQNNQGVLAFGSSKDLTRVRTLKK